MSEYVIGYASDFVIEYLSECVSEYVSENAFSTCIYISGYGK